MPGHRALRHGGRRGADRPLEPSEPPLADEGGLFDLTIEQLLPIKAYVLDQSSGLPKRDPKTGEEKVVTVFANQKGEPKKNALAMLRNIEEAKTRPLARFINGLSIRHVGPVAATALAREFRSLERIEQASEEETGGRRRGRRDHRGGGEAVVRRGVAPRDRAQVAGRRGRPGGRGRRRGRGPRPLEGLTVVVTGTLEKFTRDGAKSRSSGSERR